MGLESMQNDEETQNKFDLGDDPEYNLCVKRGDYLYRGDVFRYMVIEFLGNGTYGKVYRCINDKGEEVAIKIVKNTPLHFEYGMNEVRILRTLKEKRLNQYFTELIEAFIFSHHLCIVVELLGTSVYEILKILKFRGMIFSISRSILHQVLMGLYELHCLGISHSDLKPENILAADFYKHAVKIIDFGSSAVRPLQAEFYVQSRFYRAPEVILGIPYSTSIDVWSFGCIAYELVMGHPLFPGCSNYDQIHRIHEFFPDGLPLFMLENGTQTGKYFNKKDGYAKRNNPDRITFNIMAQNLREKLKNEKEAQMLIELIKSALTPSYLERARPRQLLDYEIFCYQDEPVQEASNVSRENIAREDEKKSTVPVKRNSVNKFEETNKRVPKDRTNGSAYDPEKENKYN
ncbi:dual specificity protein kinase YAK1 [Enteropsectra breve]|nr:dual specificity protein kinase YAK1 [Enteropsectra breve]